MFVKTLGKIKQAKWLKLYVIILLTLFFGYAANLCMELNTVIEYYGILTTGRAFTVYFVLTFGYFLKFYLL
jgi:hypothetical protein